MKIATFVLIVLAARTAGSEEILIIANSFGHADIVTPYLEAVAASNLNPFDEAEAAKRAEKSSPDQPIPQRNEFETKDAFQVRLGRVAAANLEAKRKREAFSRNLSENHAKLAKAADAARKRAIELADRSYERILVAYPTVAPRYDIDAKSFSSLPFPVGNLGTAEYGLAKMQLNNQPRELACKDLILAKQIREVSDSGNLWAMIELKGGSIRIVPGIESVKKSDGELFAENAKAIAPEIAIRLLAEYLKPGSTQGVGVKAKMPDGTKEVPTVSVVIYGESLKYLSLKDLRDKKKEIVKFE